MIHELERCIFNEANVPVLTRKLNEHLAKATASDKDELRQIMSELSKVQQQIENFVRAIANGTAFTSLLDKMGELEDRQARCKYGLKS